MQRFASLSADSPCTGRCELSETDSCIGCGRTVSEIGQWVSLTQSQRQQLLHELGLSLDKSVLCMMPGAEYGIAKQWPIEYYTELADALLAKGWQVWILGSAKDKAAADGIARQARYF